MRDGRCKHRGREWGLQEFLQSMRVYTAFIHAFGPGSSIWSQCPHDSWKKSTVKGLGF